ncbi:hypothetical protein OIU79_024883 [Salix purpurea]|uniref:Uncharacterized protein n=1 Tax=Salix purpurea TaxID=77065 RepID=A0A9Q0W495_SALPP|nr:hypothetical protein OIU79_024883 [Salix purpurea]
MLHLVQKDFLAKKQEKQDNQTEFKKPDDKVAGETSARNDASTDSKFALDSSECERGTSKETSPPVSSEPLDPEPLKNGFWHGRRLSSCEVTVSYLDCMFSQG